MMGRLIVRLRFWRRMIAFVTLTVVFWAGMELDFLLRRRRPRIELINKWVPRWAGTLMWIFGIRVEARGPHLDEGRPYPSCDERGVGRIFVSNHRSGVDIPVVFTVVQAHVISRHDLAHWPLIGGGARRIGTLFVDRASRRSGATVLRQVAQAIERGEGIAMFPEGTAFQGDEVRPFKPGAFTTAERTGAEIVPLGIAYDQPAAHYGEESFMTHMKRIACLRRVHVAVEVGQPMAVAGQSPLETKDRAHELVQELVTRARARFENPAPLAPTPALAAR
jgi:1-acyl-sn-glycerol-3-phosphate acyltransferase